MTHHGYHCPSHDWLVPPSERVCNCKVGDYERSRDLAIRDLKLILCHPTLGDIGMEMLRDTLQFVLPELRTMPD
jgi:hypothetical protein